MGLNTTFFYWTVYGWMFDFATQLFTAKSYPLVVSMSWGSPEDMQCSVSGCDGNPNDPLGYVRRVNSEFMKLAAKGITLVAASGDQGAPGDSNTQCQGGISNAFPASSPWVTAVGATMLVGSPSDSRATLPPFCKQ